MKIRGKEVRKREGGWYYKKEKPNDKVALLGSSMYDPSRVECG